MPSPARTDAIVRAAIAQKFGIFTVGNLYYVNSTSAGASDQNGNGLTPATPFATVSYAVGQCTANNGDVIIVAPGHTETIATAGGITQSIAGVTVIGQGTGNSRPTFSWSGTAATWIVSGAGSFIYNIRCTVSIDEVVTMFTLSGAGSTLDTVDVFETTAKQNINWCTVSAANCVIQNCFHRMNTASASNAQWIILTAADGVRILNNDIQITTTSNSASNVIAGVTTLSAGVFINNNRIVQLGGTATVPISLLTSTSGMVSNNHVASLKTAIAGSIALASCYGANNYAAHVVNKNGLLEPVVDA